MATQKPISTISYNTEGFLKEKLEALYEAHVIQAYMYIKHKGEDGDKDHIHLRVEPNKRIDPMNLMDDLKEYEAGNKKPLGVRPFRPSSEEDWILYAVHDLDYLALKYGHDKDGKLEYKWEDIVASDGYDVEVAFLRAKQALKHTSPSIINQLESGKRAISLLREGESPFVVNQLLRFLTESDYENLAARYADLQTAYDDLVDLIGGMSNAIAALNMYYDSEKRELIKFHYQEEMSVAEEQYLSLSEKNIVV